MILSKIPQIPEASVMLVVMLLALALMSIFAIAWARMVMLKHKNHRKLVVSEFVNMVKTKLEIKHSKVMKSNMSTKDRSASLATINKLRAKLNSTDFQNLKKPLVLESFFTHNEIQFLK